MREHPYKYVHILWSMDSNLKFYRHLIEMIQKRFCAREHLFITPHREMYDGLKPVANIEYYETGDIRDGGIVRYGLEQGDWVILHAMLAPVLLLPFGDYGRIVWRTWGSDVHFLYQHGRYVKNLLKHIAALYRRMTVRRFFAVGVANTVDEIDIRQTFGNVKTYPLGYASADIDRLRALAQNLPERTGTVNFMVGHSGYPGDHHIEILEALRKFQREDIAVHLILSYGDPDYIQTVENYVRENWVDKVIVHREFMKIEDYIAFLGSMDVVIFDSPNSYALGNICWLIEMRKTIVLNRDGVIRKAFDADGIPYVCSDSLGKLTLEELTRARDYSHMREGMKMIPYESSVGRWSALLTDLAEASSAAKRGGLAASNNVGRMIFMPLELREAA